MKYLKRALCLLLVLTMVGAALAACGGAEEPADTTAGDTTANITGGDTTTVPPATQPPATEPPATDPPATAAPCEKHIWPDGSKCTEERTCTVCQETEPAGEHTYSDLPCLVDRTCLECGHKQPAATAHVYGDAAACGTKKCQNCTSAEYSGRCSYTDLTLPCAQCGLMVPTAIPFVNIDGISIKEFTFVIPTYEKNLTHDYEHYVAALMRHRLDQWHRAGLQVVNDSTEKKGPEIRIGKTNRTVTECAEDTYIIRVVNGDLEILCDGMYAYEGLLNLLDSVLRSSNTEGIIFAEGEDMTATFEDKPEDALLGDLRILYHNIWNATSGAQKNLARKPRFSMFKKLYDHYAPDVLCLQEAPGAYFTADQAMNLKKYLNEKGYRDLNVGTGSHPIFYNSATVTLLDHGYQKAWAYGTSWALFQHKATGKYFGIGNSHFTAGSMVKEEHIAQGLSIDSVQMMDAQNVIAMRSKITEKARGRGIDVENLPIIFGGDYNCFVGSGPIQYLESAGLENVRNVITDQTKVDDYATYGHELVYNETYDYHGLNPYTAPEGNGLTRSIDHIYLHNAGKAYTANQYRVIHNLIAGGTADHQPHYVDISFK